MAMSDAYLKNDYWRNPDILHNGDHYDYAFFFHCYRQDEWDIDEVVIQDRLRRVYEPDEDASPKRKPRQEDIPGRPRPPESPTEAQKSFLEAPPVEAGGWYNSMGWRGLKILGEGGNGLAGLFTRTDEDGKEHRIVIKSDINGNTMDYEAETMLKLRRGNPRPQHIVNFLKDPNNPEEPTKEEDFLNENILRWEKYIAIEVCDNGDLYGKLSRCRENRTPLAEKELWSVFSCLVKAVTVLDNGTENPSSQSLLKWPICHFDIKPKNIFIGGNDNDHVESLIYKLGDYGLAEEINETKWNQRKKTRFRKVATFGYYAPEQFSERWDFKGRFIDNDIVGNYGTHTNIWWIAAVMWQLVLLTGPPPAKGFIVPANVSEDLHRRGTTYGSRILHPGGYSDTLKHLILQCLCESPGQRPDLRDLHRRIRQGRISCQNANAPTADDATGDNEPGDHSAGSMDFWFTPQLAPIFIDLTSDQPAAKLPSLSAFITRFEQAVQDIHNGNADYLVAWEKHIEACLQQARDPRLHAEEVVSLKEIMVGIMEKADMSPIPRYQSESRSASALAAVFARGQATQGAGLNASPIQPKSTVERRRTEKDEPKSTVGRRQTETDEPSQHTPLSQQRVKRKRSTDDDDVSIDINARKRRRIKSPEIMILNDDGEWKTVEGASQDGNTEGGQDTEDVAEDQDASAVEAGNDDEAEDVNRDGVEDDLPDYVSEE